MTRAEKIAGADAEFNKVHAVVLAEFNKVRDAAKVECDKVCAAARDVYINAGLKAWAEYTDVCAELKDD